MDGPAPCFGGSQGCLRARSTTTRHTNSCPTNGTTFAAGQNSRLVSSLALVVLRFFSRLLLPSRRTVHGCMHAGAPRDARVCRTEKVFDVAKRLKQKTLWGGEEVMTSRHLSPTDAILSVLQSPGWVTDRRRFRCKLLLRQSCSTSTSQCPCRYPDPLKIQKTIQDGSPPPL